MKLYGTIQSERASKGQGGNDYLRIELTIQHDNGERMPFGVLVLDQGENEKRESEFVLAYASDRNEDLIEIDRMVNKKKGEKEKSEEFCSNCNEEVIPDKMGNCPICGVYVTE